MPQEQATRVIKMKTIYIYMTVQLKPAPLAYEKQL